MWPDLLIPALKIAGVLGVLMTTVAYAVLAERRVAAWIQDRRGPNRVGWHGLLQPVADGIKVLLKEDILPTYVRRGFFILAPLLVIAPPLLIAGVIPWGSRLGGEPCVIADLDVGLLYVLAVAPLTVYGLALAGWSSRSRYAFLGGIRSSAQLIAYEVCLAVGLLGVVLQCGSLNLGQIVGYQAQHGWLIVYQPFGFLVCLVSLCAETNRLPFDLPEAEQELVAGYHTEYSSMKFGLFFMGEFASLIVASALLVTLFLGGWSLPFAPFNAPAAALWVGVAHLGIFLAKTFLVVFGFMWARWTFPRFRYDRVMRLGWTALLWVALANLVATAVVLTLTR